MHRIYKRGKLELKIKEINEDKINDIFCNRGEFSEKEYISRQFYEMQLGRYLDRNKYVFVKGESGCGKTWLINHILKGLKVEYEFVNMASVKMQGGFYFFFKNALPEIKMERNETMSASANALAVMGGLETEKVYSIGHDYLWEYLKSHNKKIIVFDNFESIIEDRQILNELSCIITLADDPQMLKTDTKFVIIGATSDIMQYFEEMPNYQTIANRVAVMRVNGFNDTECRDFISKRFRDCAFTLSNLDALSNYIFARTNGMPQSVNDLCYYIAIAYLDARQTNIVQNSSFVEEGEKNWVDARLDAEYSLIRGLYKENVKTDIKNNHILFALRNYRLIEFSSSEVLAYIDSYLNREIKGMNKTAVKKYLIKLADDSKNRNILEKTCDDGYKVKSYKTFACINIVLVNENDNIKIIEK